MKKVIYIVFAIFALGLTSCSKQDIQPTVTPTDVDVPVSKSFGSNDHVINNNGGGTITDPELEVEEEAHGGVGN
ncbi:hypothetical protein N9F08_00735 [bacterium]|nr:hypothetical protein [bacterium]